MAQILKTKSVTVTTPGTAVPLSTSRIYTTAFAVRAKLTNNGNIFLGDSTVTSSTGMFLQPGETNEKTAQNVSRGVIQTFELSKIYIDAQNGGEGVIIEYLAEEV